MDKYVELTIKYGMGPHMAFTAVRTYTERVGLNSSEKDALVIALDALADFMRHGFIPTYLKGWDER